MYHKEYAEVFDGTPEWQAIKVSEAATYDWDEGSTYIRLSPFFDDMEKTPKPVEDIRGARLLAILGIRSQQTIFHRQVASKQKARQGAICWRMVSSAMTSTPMARVVVTTKS